MVKRTLVVLSIVSLMLMAAGSSFAFFGGICGFNACEPEKPIYLPVDCPPYCETRTIVKTWEAKVVGPAPCAAPVAACGGDSCIPGIAGAWNKPGLFGGILAAIPTPLDFLFGGFDGVYGCGPGGCGAGGPCAPCGGPLATAFHAPMMALGAPTTIFGALW